MGMAILGLVLAWLPDLLWGLVVMLLLWLYASVIADKVQEKLGARIDKLSQKIDQLSGIDEWSEDE